MNYYEIEVHSARHNSELVAEVQAILEAERLAGRAEERGRMGAAEPRARKWRFRFHSPFRHSPA